MTPDSAEGWRPIESAPKDGTQVLIHGAHGAIVAWWGDREPVDFMSDAPHEPHMCWLGHSNGKYDPVALRLDYIEPTHWRPLPEPPK
jgi:hypothetical protein